MFLTRKQYDKLVTFCWAWMAAHWSEYRKQWGVNGVMVSAPSHKLENLKSQLDWVVANT